MGCNSSWKLKTRLQTILTGIYYQKQFSDFQILSQGKDWENLDRLVFIASQKARLLARLLQRADGSVSYSTHLQLQRDAYWNSDSWNREPASILWLLVQELALEEILLAEAGVHISGWFDPMIQFLLGRIAGVYWQNPVSQQQFLDVRLPMPDFVSKKVSEQLNQKLQKLVLPEFSEGKVVLEFLNQSMKAQYLELKNLIPQDEFKISEFEFRRRHLRAYAF